MPFDPDNWEALKGSAVATPATPVRTDTGLQGETVIDGESDDPLDKGIPYYPSKRHVTPDKNGYPQAPEVKLTYNDVRNIAQARNEAISSGVLTKDLAEHLLPMAMVEGHPANFGIKNNNEFYNHKSTRDFFTKMGLTVDTEDKKPDIAINKERNMLYPAKSMETSLGAARTMAAIVAEKARVAKSQVPEIAIKKYNGKGKAIENDFGLAVPADVNKYWSKVQEARELLPHPLNKDFYDFYNVHTE
jgi:hypothetical protein